MSEPFPILTNEEAARVAKLPLEEFKKERYRLAKEQVLHSDYRDYSKSAIFAKAGHWFSVLSARNCFIDPKEFQDQGEEIDDRWKFCLDMVAEAAILRYIDQQMNNRESGPL